jgi:hypothetical protein
MSSPFESIPTVPEQNTKPPATIPWEHRLGGGIGAFLVTIADLDISANLELFLNVATAIGVG